MDTLTHALLGAALVRATAPAKGRSSGVALGTRTWAGGLAAALPDIDYLGFWIAPLTFLAQWHRGPTHSLVLLPFWAVLFGLTLSILFRDPKNWRLFVGICALALLSHVASDLVTAYGTQILSPISDYRVAFATTFVVDPYFSAIVIGSLVAALHFSKPLASRLGLLALAGYLCLQVVLQQQAKALGDDYVNTQGLENASVQALPQPLSPFNWMVIVSEGQRHHSSLVNLAGASASSKRSDRLGWAGRLQSAYKPRNALIWSIHERYGPDARLHHLAEEVWNQQSFSEFRQFARFPILFRIDETGEDRCVWYTDLRYVLPGFTPPFRYGMCGTGGVDTWGLFRLRRFTDGERQFLGGLPDRTLDLNGS
jgi:inner membrane protein